MCSALTIFTNETIFDRSEPLIPKKLWTNIIDSSLGESDETEKPGEVYPSAFLWRKNY